MWLGQLCGYGVALLNKVTTFNYGTCNSNGYSSIKGGIDQQSQKEPHPGCNFFHDCGFRNSELSRRHRIHRMTHTWGVKFCIIQDEARKSLIVSHPLDRYCYLEW